MPWASKHTKWLVDTGERLKTAGGKEVEVWEFRHEKNEAVLTAWAKHFRNHYCIDSKIDYWRRWYKCSRAEYLNNIKFPDPNDAPGPSIRAGDFGEVLVADFLEYLLGYWVPRTRYGDKTIRNESTKERALTLHPTIQNTISTKTTCASFTLTPRGIVVTP